MIGTAITAGANLIGGAMNRSAAKDAQAQNLHQTELNREMQEEFAKKGIRWKVADAKAAGIHPAFALGANTNSFTPVNFQAAADTSMGDAVSKMGTDLGRAVNATRTGPERIDAYTQSVRALTLQKGALENDLLASQIAKLKTSTPPPMPITAPLEMDKPGKATPLLLGGVPVQTNRNFSDGGDQEQRWGEWGGSLGGIATMIADLVNTTQHHFPIGTMPWDKPYEDLKSHLRNWRGFVPSSGGVPPYAPAARPVHSGYSRYFERR